jgi:mono/diheme cytochrome c family protein
MTQHSVKSTIILAAMSAVILAGSWAAGQAGGNPKAGQALYEQHCLRCHGDKLDGRGPDAQYLIVPPADLRSPVARNKTDRELFSAISEVVLFSPMHGFRGKLTDQQIRDVLAYLRTQFPPEFIS